MKTKLLNNKNKGYVLVIVMMYCLAISMALLTIFSVVLRYQGMAEQLIDELRDTVFVSALR